MEHDDNGRTAAQVHEDALRFRAKRELRKRLRAVRATLPAAAIAERSRLITERVLALPSWQAAQCVALFVSLPDEVQTAALIAAARAAGKRVALPVVGDGPALCFRAPFDGGVERALVTSAYGIAEPGADAPEVPLDALDFVLVPALAVDCRGHRIGYGAGYYDHTLPGAKRAAWVLVAFDFQLLAEVPERAGDQRVHWIVTDRRSEPSVDG